jgi:hypothetical protein
MRKPILIILITAVFAACNNDPQPRRPGSSATSSVKKPTPLNDLPWATAINPETGNTVLQQMPVNTSSVTSDQILHAANKKYPQVQLEWIKQDGNTAYLKINDASYLTQSMGSAGAEAYLSEITYSFTEIKGIKAVSLDFEEGDHASPGVFTRDQFKDLTQ